VTIPISDPFDEPYPSALEATAAGGPYRTPRPPVVTSPTGDLTISSVDGGVRLTANPFTDPPGSLPSQELVGVVATGLNLANWNTSNRMLDLVCTQALMLPRSHRWREAVETALVGDWSDALWDTGFLPVTSLGALRAAARVLHRQLVPVWQRGTRAGRVLSLDADLGGLSLYDLIAAEVDLLGRTVDGVLEDERLNCVLRGLDPAERAVVLAYARGEGATWMEAAAAAGASYPKAFGERVRRKTKRLAAEQARRAEQSRPGSVCG
jgi:hypothetical protein